MGEEVNISPDLISSSEALILLLPLPNRLDHSDVSQSVSNPPGAQSVYLLHVFMAEVIGQAECLYMLWPKEEGRLFCGSNNSH